MPEKIRIYKTSLPATSLLYGGKYNYVDGWGAWVSDMDDKINVDGVVRCFFSYSPKWVTRLFALRNALVRFIGLKVPHNKPDITNATFQPGDRFGLFKVFARNENEIILGEDDKHLDFKVSIDLASPTPGAKLITLSTVVTIHNNLGRVYFAVVKPFHKRVVQSMLKQIATRLAAGDKKKIQIG